MCSILKCRRCRNVLIDQKETAIIDNHSRPVDQVNNSLSYDCGGKVIDVWYFQETEVPEWVLNSINEVSKLNSFPFSRRIPIKMSNFLWVNFFVRRLNGRKENYPVLGVEHELDHSISFLDPSVLVSPTCYLQFTL